MKNYMVSLTLNDREKLDLAEKLNKEVDELSSENIGTYFYNLLGYEKKKTGKKSELTLQDLEQMQVLINRGVSKSDIAKEYNVHPSYVTVLIRRDKLVDKKNNVLTNKPI